MTPRTLNSGYSGKEFSIYNMIFLSLIIHLIIITVIVVSVPTTSRHLTFGPVYSVQLVNSSDVAISANHESSLMKEIEKSNEAASSIIYKRQVSGLAPTPMKSEEVSKVNIEKAVSIIRQKQINTPEPVSNTKRNQGNTAARMSAGDFNNWANEYSAGIKLRVTKNFSIPSGLEKENIEAIIAIKILRDGTIDYTGFEKRSGNRVFDDAALKAVKKSAPFLHFPETVRDNSIEIGIRFHPSQLR